MLIYVSLNRKKKKERNNDNMENAKVQYFIILLYCFWKNTYFKC